MVDIKTLTDLYNHMQWADAAVWTSVLASENGQTDAKLRDYFYHLHLVQHMFLRLWRDELRETPPPPSFDNAQSLIEWARDYYGKIFAHLDTLEDEKISEPVPMPWANMVEQQLGRPPEMATISETMLQVALHSLYHRGQINARLREIGGAPPLVDYIAWIWLGRPAPDWPSVAQS